MPQAIRYEPPGSTNAYRWRVVQFSPRYQPKGIDYVIPASETGLDTTYTFGYGYSEATGEQTSISYPSGGGLVAEEVTTDYDATTGMPVRLDTSFLGSAGTMATASYTAYGERSGTIYKMPGGKFTREVVYRDDATRCVTRAMIDRETVAGTVSDRTYHYDDAGNITSIADTPEVGEADIQCFRHDTLGRLTTAWTPRSGVGCETDPTVVNLGGPAPYWHDWTFDTTGSRLTETNHTAAGDTTRSYTLPAGGQGVVRPHAVTTMTTTAPGQSDVVARYDYDETGNTICRPAGTSANDCTTHDGSQTLSWDAEGRLASVSTGGQTIETNIYDANGVRLIRRDATGTTLFLPGQEIRREGGVNVATRYYSFAGTICASRTGATTINNLTWLYPDHQGTQQIAINANTQAVTIRRQTPYGAARGEEPVWVNSKGFVGGDIDPTGLIHIGARQYDTTLGRFISVDPVMDLADPQQWNPYAYSYNSPITNSDPTGTKPECGGGTGYYECSSGVRKANPEVNRGSWPDNKSKGVPGDPKAFEKGRERAEAARRERECQASFWCRNSNRLKRASSAVLDFAAEHADVVGVVTGAVVGLGCTVLTGGTGAIFCGALAGAVTGLVSGGLQCYGGDNAHCGLGLAVDVVVGTGLGALSGAASASLGGALSAGLRGVAPATGAAVRGTVAAARQLTPARIGAFINASARAWATDVIAMGGRAPVIRDTGRMVLEGAVSASGVSAGVVAAVAPTTRDDVKSLVHEGVSFHPVKTPVQVIAAMLGGGFR